MLKNFIVDYLICTGMSFRVLIGTILFSTAFSQQVFGSKKEVDYSCNNLDTSVLNNSHFAQQKIHTSKGIIFLDGYTWNQVKTIAKREKKAILVNCYATGCDSCKMMEKEVYSHNQVSEFVNANLISFKLQMDSTFQDQEFVKANYKIARQFEIHYNINTLPTYLFFSESGGLLRKEIGYKNKNDFKSLLSEVKDANKTFNDQIFQAISGSLSAKNTQELAYRIKNQMGDAELALVVAKAFKLHYLNHYDEQQLLEKQNLVFVSNFFDIVDPDDKMFSLYYYVPSKVDAIMGLDGFSEGATINVLIKKLIRPLVEQTELKQAKPDWNKAEVLVAKGWGKYLARKSVLQAQIDWYKKRGDRVTECKYAVLFTENYYGWEKYTTEPLGQVLNNRAYYVFKYGNDPNDLRKALRWVDKALLLINNLDSKVNTLDTKVNILYKLGNKEQAIKIAEEAISVSRNKAIIATLSKIMLDQPTWIEALRYDLKD